MGLLDSVITTIRGGQSSSGPAQVSLLPAVIEFVNSYPGGLPGLLQKFQQGGLGGVVASWVGAGQNEPISPTQLQSVLGDDAVAQLAQSSGQEPDSVLGNLSSLLPTLVDHVTPDGRLDNTQELDATALLGSVSGLLNKL